MNDYGFTGRNHIEGVVPMNAFVNPEHVARLERWRAKRAAAEIMEAFDWRRRAHRLLRKGRIGFAKDYLRIAGRHIRMAKYFRRPE